jgi:hypothetical protein
MGHWALGMGHGALGMGHWVLANRAYLTTLENRYNTVSAGAGLLKFLVCIRDFDEPAPR